MNRSYVSGGVIAVVAEDTSRGLYKNLFNVISGFVMSRAIVDHHIYRIYFVRSI